MDRKCGRVAVVVVARNNRHTKNPMQVSARYDSLLFLALVFFCASAPTKKTGLAGRVWARPRDKGVDFFPRVP